MGTRPYRELVGALAWLALGTRPDIAFATSSLARFGHNPGRIHWEAAKRVLRYLKGTKGWCLTLGDSPEIAGYTDADWGSHRDDRRSIGAYVIRLGSGIVSWKSKKQPCVALSSTEAEYMALCQAAKESVWMVDFLKSLGVSISDPMTINVDNQGGISLARDPVFHDRSKHIDIQYHYTRDLLKEGRVNLNYVSTKEMIADLLTKALPRVLLEITVDHASSAIGCSGSVGDVGDVGRASHGYGGQLMRPAAHSPHGLNLFNAPSLPAIQYLNAS
jgi:hypothetical protein